MNDADCWVPCAILKKEPVVARLKITYGHFMIFHASKSREDNDMYFPFSSEISETFSFKLNLAKKYHLTKQVQGYFPCAFFHMSCKENLDWKLKRGILSLTSLLFAPYWRYYVCIINRGGGGGQIKKLLLWPNIMQQGPRTRFNKLTTYDYNLMNRYWYSFSVSHTCCW